MGVEVEEDLKRKMVELNLTAAAAALSPQTGYIHLNYEVPGRSDTIPLLENFSWILALFRSRLSENVLLGKGLLEKLLPFEVEGNFPVYLHDYPQCKDRDFSLELLPIFHWILYSFRTALGDVLSVRLEALTGRILSHAYRMHRQRPLCASSEFRLKSFFEPGNVPQWIPATPDEWASALISCQMGVSLGTLDQPLFARAVQKWHPQLAVYMGAQEQDHEAPKVTLYDLFMGHYFGLYSSRALCDSRTALLAALVHSFEGRADPAPCPVPCCAIEPSAIHPLVLYWGSPEELHSFVIDSKNATCAITKREGEVEIGVHFSPSSIPEGQDAVELSFFANLCAAPNLRIQDATGPGKATTFQLGDVVALNDHVRLQIVLEKGAGRFFGHVLRANRPSQKGKNLKYETYDWQIALRTIRRSDDCVLKVLVDI